MMQSNDYSSTYDAYNDYNHQQQQPNEVDQRGLSEEERGAHQQHEDPASSSAASRAGGILFEGSTMGGEIGENSLSVVNFNDSKIAKLPRILLMGPRRGGKTSIQARLVMMLSYV